MSVRQAVKENAPTLNEISLTLIAAAMSTVAWFSYQNTGKLNAITVRQKSYAAALDNRKAQIDRRWDKQDVINDRQSQQIYRNSNQLGVLQNRVDHIERSAP